MTYRELFDKASKILNAKAPKSPVNICTIHCYNAVESELQFYKKLSKKLKIRYKRVEKLKKLNAPEIIMFNEYYQLGILQGMHLEIKRVGRLCAVSDALKDCDASVELKGEVMKIIGRENCGNCAYFYDCGEMDENGLHTKCLCNAATVGSVFGPVCEHFKIEAEPFFEVYDKQEGTDEEKMSKAIVAVNERNKAEWESEGCPDYTPIENDNT